MNAIGPRARIAWIPPFTPGARQHFLRAKAEFEAYGFSNVLCCDIDQERDGLLLDHLTEFDVVYLTGGDPIGFRHNILHADLASKLQACVSAGRLVVGASGG